MKQNKNKAFRIALSEKYVFVYWEDSFHSEEYVHVRILYKEHEESTKSQKIRILFFISLSFIEVEKEYICLNDNK